MSYAEKFEQGFKFQKDAILMLTSDICQDLTAFMSNGVPRPALILFVEGMNLTVIKVIVFCALLHLYEMLCMEVTRTKVGFQRLR